MPLSPRARARRSRPPPRRAGSPGPGCRPPPRRARRSRSPGPRPGPPAPPREQPPGRPTGPPAPPREQPPGRPTGPPARRLCPGAPHPPVSSSSRRWWRAPAGRLLRRLGPAHPLDRGSAAGHASRIGRGAGRDDGVGGRLGRPHAAVIRSEMADPAAAGVAVHRPSGPLRHDVGEAVSERPLGLGSPAALRSPRRSRCRPCGMGVDRPCRRCRGPAGVHLKGGQIRPKEVPCAGDGCLERLAAPPADHVADGGVLLLARRPGRRPRGVARRPLAAHDARPARALRSPPRRPGRRGPVIRRRPPRGAAGWLAASRGLATTAHPGVLPWSVALRRPRARDSRDRVRTASATRRPGKVRSGRPRPGAGAAGGRAARRHARSPAAAPRARLPLPAPLSRRGRTRGRTRPPRTGAPACGTRGRSRGRGPPSPAADRRQRPGRPRPRPRSGCCRRSG